VIDDTAEKMAVGRVVGYNKALNPFKRQYKVRISVNNRTVTALVDDSQFKFIRKKYWTGGRLAVGYYGGKWHIGIPQEVSGEKHMIPEEKHMIPEEKHMIPEEKHMIPEEKHMIPEEKHMIPEEKRMDDDNNTVDLLEKELIETNIKELIGPLDKSIDSVSGVPSKVITLEDNLLQDIDKFSGYLKWVEQYTRENADDILDRIQLSHLNADSVQKLRLSDIAAVDNKKNHRAPEDYIEVLDYIIAQNDEIILSQNEVIRLLTKISSHSEEDPYDE